MSWSVGVARVPLPQSLALRKSQNTNSGVNVNANFNTRSPKPKCASTSPPTDSPGRINQTRSHSQRLSAYDASAPTTPCAMSQFVSVKVRTNVQIPFAHLGFELQGVDAILNERVLRYDSRLEGALLAYENVEIQSGSGALRADTPFVHLDVTFNGLLLNLQRDAKIQATVTSASETYVRCSLCGVVPVLVDGASMRASGYEWSSGSWQKTSSNVRPDERLSLRVLRVDDGGGRGFAVHARP